MEKITNPSPWLVKIAAVLLAVALWFYVSYAENPEMNSLVRGIPVSITGTADLRDKGFAVSEISVKTVDVRIKVRRTQLNQFNSQTISASVSVSGISGVGEYDLPLLVTLPSTSASLADRSVTLATVKIEPYSQKELPVQFVPSGEVRGGLVLDEIILSPEKVTVDGAKSAVDKVDSVSTEAVDMSSFTESSVITARLYALDKDGGVIDEASLSSESAVATVSFLASKEVPVQPDMRNIDNESPDSISCTVTPEKVTVVGSASIIDNIEYVMTDPIDMSSFYADTQMTIDLNIPTGVKIAEDIERVSAQITFN
ncbi:MAG: CdaR family protein [Clostridia bacterium]|nr:CdaR family protein [Clostridia bacterium]